MDTKYYYVNPQYGRARTKCTKEDTQCKEEGPASILWGRGTCAPPSTDDTPIEAAKTRRSPGSGISGATKKRDKRNCSNAIGQKKSKSDDEESLGGVANLESMDETPLKPKGSKSTSRKGLAKKDKAAKTPDSGRKRQRLQRQWKKRW
jgi:hypothetical protein